MDPSTMTEPVKLVVRFIWWVYTELLKLTISSN